MTTALAIHVRITPLVKTQKTASLVPVHQNIRVHCVKHGISATVKTAATTEAVRMGNKIILVIVNQSSLEQIVNKETSVVVLLVGMESVGIQKMAFIVLVWEGIQVLNVM